MRSDLARPARAAPSSREQPPNFGRWRSWLILAALALLPLLVFLKPALLQAVFYIHDVQYYFYPYHAIGAAIAARGSLPLWNPYAFSGIPLLGDGQTAMFYPPNWLFFLLPGGAALNYAVLLQFSIAGVGTYLFARSLRLWRLPAGIGAVAYMFCGFMTTRVVHLSILSGAALIPLLFWCVERSLRSGHRRWFAAAAGAVALQAVAGHPQVPVYSALAIGLYTLVRAAEYRWVSRDWRWFYRLPLRLAGIYLLGYGLAAIQLVPWVELGSLSPRAAGASFDFVFGGSMVGSHWLLFLFPYLYGSIMPSIYSANPIGIAASVKLWEHSAYVGILPLALAAYGLLGPGPGQGSGVRGQGSGDGRPGDGRPGDRETGDQETERRETGDWRPETKSEDHAAHQPPSPIPRPPSPASRWFSLVALALLLAVGLIIAAGRHTPFAGLIYLTPVIGKLRDVERALALVAFALALLAAFGLQRIIEPQPRRVWRPSLLVIAGITILLPLAVLWAARQPGFQQLMLLQPQDLAHLQWRAPNAAVPLALALVSAGLLLWWSQRRAGAISQALVAGLIVLDLGSYAALFNPTTDSQLYQREPDVLAAFQHETAPFRKATIITNNDLDNRTAQESLAISWSMVYGVDDINGFNSLQPRRYTDFLFGPQYEDVSYGYLNNPQLFRPESPILSQLNVKYLLVPTGVELPLGANFRPVYANEQVRVYENMQAYPRAYFAASVRGATDQQAVLRAVTADGFDGRQEALIESPQPPQIALASAASSDRVEVTAWDANSITLSTNTSAQRLLVLSEMYFPGWRATIDGVETPIYRTNYLFRGVAVPDGQHTISFVYQPLSALLGAAVTLLALAIVGALVLRRR